MVQSGQLSLVQFQNDEWVEWNRLTGRSRFGVAFDVVPNGMGDVGLHEFKADIAQRRAISTAAKTGAAVQHDHHTLTLRQFKQ